MRVDPVGFFDSGLGGLCILEAFQRICPNESTVYVADSVHCPYGNREVADVVTLSMDNAELLLSRYRCKMIVVACNTATAAAICQLRERWPEVPFVGIEPAVKPAALRSRTGVVGVLATAGTLGGRLYNETRAKFARNVTVIATVADEWVTEVERLNGARIGTLSADEHERLRGIVARRVEPLLAAGADKLVLGCTHFPHLRPLVEEVVSGRAEVLEPSEAVARQACRVLNERSLANSAVGAPPRHVFVRRQ